MNNATPKAEIPPVRLGKNARFQFRCHPGVSCFTECCRGIQIVLTPYDIIGLKTRLGLSSEEFLAIYTDVQLMEKTGLPMVTLKLLDDDRRSCPFVREDGCIIYEDRPSTCRYYPLGVGSLMHKEDADDEGFYFFVNEPHCKGFEEEKQWTVADWRQDQGVDLRDEINAKWTDLIVRKRSFPGVVQLTEKAKRLFFMVSYNIDKFRQFVFESSFLERYPVAPEKREELRREDAALLQFGLDWLKGIFFQQPDSVRDKADGGV